jgi:hypothetical protein
MTTGETVDRFLRNIEQFVVSFRDNCAVEDTDMVLFVAEVRRNWWVPLCLELAIPVHRLVVVRLCCVCANRAQSNLHCKRSRTGTPSSWCRSARTTLLSS